MIKQEVEWYFNYTNISYIYEDMKKWIEDGWRVHTCLNRSSDVLVIYEKDIAGD
jgi:hypothetical protein